MHLDIISYLKSNWSHFINLRKAPVHKCMAENISCDMKYVLQDASNVRNEPNTMFQSVNYRAFNMLHNIFYLSDKYLWMKTEGDISR